jgi:hypothetical protein
MPKSQMEQNSNITHASASFQTGNGLANEVYASSSQLIKLFDCTMYVIISQ